MITYLSMKAYVCIATKMTRLAKGANSHFFTLGYAFTTRSSPCSVLMSTSSVATVICKCAWHGAITPWWSGLNYITYILYTLTSTFLESIHRTHSYSPRLPPQCLFPLVPIKAANHAVPRNTHSTRVAPRGPRCAGCQRL